MDNHSIKYSEDSIDVEDAEEVEVIRCSETVTPCSSILPFWLSTDEPSHPIEKDRGLFISKSLLTLTSVLQRFRLDDGTEGRLNFSAPAKMLFVVGCILLTSLSNNYVFSLFVLACVLIRLCFLKSTALKKTFGTAFMVALITAAVMLPALLIGQNTSIILLPTKLFISVAIVLSIASSTPFNQLTSGLRVLHLPDVVIMIFDLSLKNIVSLGETAIEVLEALKCRSVGRDCSKMSSIGGVGGVVFLKSHEKASGTYDALCCRGYSGEYKSFNSKVWSKTDLCLLLLFLGLCTFFIYTQIIIS